MRSLALLLIASAAHAAPCKPELVANVPSAWGLATAPAMRCTPIRARSPMVLVEASMDDEKTAPIGGYAAVVDVATGNVPWTRESYPGTPGSTYAFVVIDLDGDGTDELLVHERHDGHMGSSSEVLYAYEPRDRDLAEAGQLALGEAGIEGGNPCTGSWAVVGGRTTRVQITATRFADPKRTPAPESCPLDGVHRYRWTGALFALAD